MGFSVLGIILDESVKLLAIDLKSGFADVQPFLFKCHTKILNYVYNSKNGEPFCPIFAIAVNYFEKYT